MAIASVVKKNHYQDSLKLMQLSRKLSALPGIRKAAAIMATEANLKMLREAGLIAEAPDGTNANDLIVAVDAESELKARGAIDMLDSLITPAGASRGGTAEAVKGLDFALNIFPGANIALISVPGEYAKLECSKAIEKGLHTFLFSDNVTVEEEIELKRRASGRGLLVMGPGCGTAIINGTGLGFANVVNKGPIGVAAAAGTGMQEVTSLLSNWGSGITHAIGVGGRDLSGEVGGITTLDALRILGGDNNTKVLLVVSKPPSKKVAEKILAAIGETGKPAVVCFLGHSMRTSGDEKIKLVSTLEEAAYSALALVNGSNKKYAPAPGKDWKRQAGKYVRAQKRGQRYLRGIFSGGTLCYEAQHILAQTLGDIYSNAPLDKKNRLKDSNVSVGNTCVDLGEEEFTVGRPHPMIDAALRSERIVSEAGKPDVAVILFDVVLGYVASPDPAGDLLPAIKAAKASARKKGRSIAFVAHVCGTVSDPQGLRNQEAKLKKEGVMVFRTNALAARAAGFIAAGGREMEIDRGNK
ncbi:MAG TPA: acyl-CoA synthetase FdrA [Thermodesulfobacteriota bacterium]|nr:acyl-CoA synthetase FdrA [Thermodesulfobacteriota bacterium]